jgi:hypothetical protein
LPVPRPRTGTNPSRSLHRLPGGLKPTIVAIPRDSSRSLAPPFVAIPRTAIVPPVHDKTGTPTSIEDLIMLPTKAPKEYPVSVAGVDWQSLKKGDVIPEAKIDEMWDILFGGTRKKDPNFVSLAVKEWLEGARTSIGAPLVFRQDKADLVALTDEQAVSYLNGQAMAGLRKHRNNTRRMFTHITVDQLSEHGASELERNQARHALIAAAADGARRQAVSLLRSGARMPKLMPPEG